VTELAPRSPAAAASPGPSAQSALLVAAAFTVAHLIVAARAELVPDETYYWIWSQYPSAGYYDHPPMVALWVAAGTRLFGDGALAMRLITVLTVPFVSLVLYRTARTLFAAPAIAARAVIWFNLTLLVALGGFLVTPDAPSLAFWSLAVFALAKVMKTDDGRWWLAVGLFAGLGVASKYTNLFLGAGIVLWLFVDRPSRRWLATLWPYAGGAVALLVFLPVILWNAGHDWASFEKQFGRVDSTGFGLETFGEFIGTQFLLLNPFIAVIAAVAVIGRFRKGGPWRRETGLMILTAAPLVIYMTFHSLHSRVEGNWLVPVYPALVLLAAAIAEEAMPRWLIFVRRAVLPFGLACAAAGLFAIAAPVESVLAKILSPRFVGWNELAAAVERQMAETGATWVATTLYGTTGELTLRLPAVPVIQINERVRYAFQPQPSLPEGPAILIAEPVQTGAEGCFASIRPLALFTPPGLKPARGYVLSLAEGPMPDLIDKGCPIERPKPRR
jgi:4-amino-4-deoxy-L-arabinose transferase-like glycosyltransferase